MRGVDLVDHEVDDDAGDGDVEPERQGPAGDEAVLIEALEEGAAKRDDDERNDGDGEDGMGDEDGEVDRADPTLSLEQDDLVSAEVMDHVGDQEGAGDEEGGEHELFVEFALAGAYGGVASGKENPACAVEDGVEGGVGDRGKHLRFGLK
jgi:hypothetical protein